ncbi:Uncharacterised protein [Mycobacteroides abscessus subsp. abscessus]|nr:Uncharacterised protein [Mycobacteroides abscessus subsp. abscessus]
MNAVSGSVAPMRSASATAATAASCALVNSSEDGSLPCFWNSSACAISDFVSARDAASESVA